MKNKIIALVFIILLILSFVIFILPPDTKSFEKENRSITELPAISFESVVSGEFASNFEGYVNDRISFRSQIMNISKKIEENKGIAPPQGKVVYTNKDIGTETVKKACLLIANNKIMEVFQKEESQKYSDAINKISENIDENINIYSMVVPTQLEFEEKIYKNIQSSQKKAIDEIYSKLNPRIKKVDVYSSLEEHKDEYIYFKSDHHWTMLGAYYGYCAFMKEKGETAASLSDFEKNEINGFLGHLYEQVNDENIKNNPDTIEWYDTQKDADLTLTMKETKDNGEERTYTSLMFDKTKSNYNFFFSADHAYMHIENKKIQNNKTLLVIKDSYANIFLPWCVNNYENIIVIDPRTYKNNLKDVFNSNKIDDVLVINYIFTTTFEDYCAKMVSLFK